MKYLIPLILSAALIIFSSVSLNDWQIDHQIFFLDKIYHFLGGAIAAWLAALYFNDELGRLSKPKRLLAIVATACLVGVLWEFAEWASAVYSPEFFPLLARYFWIGDLADTLGDLAIDMLGAGAFAVAWIYRKP